MCPGTQQRDRCGAAGRSRRCSQLVKERRRSAGTGVGRAAGTDARPSPTTKGRSMRRAARSIRSASTAPSARIKWIVLFVTLGIYYGAAVRALGPRAERARPGGADRLSRTRRFYFFFIEIWPQEVYYLTGLLIIAAMALFLMNAVAGRVWCGYLCPQTVWTDLFQAIERWVEGDRREHLLRDQQPWTARADRARRRSSISSG